MTGGPQQDPGGLADTPQGDPASLSRMHDLVLPEAVDGWWPLAPGWWVLLGALALALLLLGLRAWLRWRADAYRRAALRALDATPDAELSALLKRTALAAWPRPTVASLSGVDWLRFLDRTGRQPAFESGPGRALLELAWRPDVDAGVELRESVRDWLRHHRRDRRPEEAAC